MKIILSFILLLYLLPESFAIYDVNDNCKRAWQLLMDFKIDEAKVLLEGEISKDPENYYLYYLDQTCDAYKMVINSNEEDYKKFKEGFYAKRDIMDGKDEESPYYLACYSEMEIQLGMFNVINGDQFSGLKKMYTAYKRVYRNLEKYPDFKPSLKLDGFFNVSISNLPPFAKWAVSFFGVSVDIDYGFKILYENYLSQSEIPGINAESALFIILSAKINKTPDLVYDFTKSLDSNISATYVHKYFRANIAYRTGKNEEAYHILKGITNNVNKYTDITYNYLMGKVLMRRLDKNAKHYLKKYLSTHKHEEYLKEINNYLAIYHLLNGDEKKYHSYAEIVRENGMDLQERDREALYDVSIDYIPDVNLVKARLLIDGGYSEKFKSAIKLFDLKSNEIIGHELDYLSLKARFEAQNNNTYKAIVLFKKVIEIGEDEDYYFASEAALRLGEIYLENGDKDQANDYLKKSIKLYKNDYYEYIEDKARKALSRL